VVTREYWARVKPGQSQPHPRNIEIHHFSLRLNALVNTLTIMSSPAAWIREQRTRLGLSTRDLARLAGVSYPTISRIENGHEDPRWQTLEKIFEVLGHSLSLAANTQRQTRLADLSDAWIEDATHAHHPDWTRLRAFADQLRLNPAHMAQAIMPEPPRSRSEIMNALLASMAEKIADDAGIARPSWTRKRPPLSEMWSVATRPSKRAEAEAATPDQFLHRNLLIPETTIWRNRKLIVA